MALRILFCLRVLSRGDLRGFVVVTLEVVTVVLEVALTARALRGLALFTMGRAVALLTLARVWSRSALRGLGAGVMLVQ